MLADELDGDVDNAAARDGRDVIVVAFAVIGLASVHIEIELLGRAVEGSGGAALVIGVEYVEVGENGVRHIDGGAAVLWLVGQVLIAYGRVYEANVGGCGGGA